jgi:hypothetical protein
LGRRFADRGSFRSRRAIHRRARGCRQIIVRTLERRAFHRWLERLDSWLRRNDNDRTRGRNWMLGRDIRGSFKCSGSRRLGSSEHRLVRKRQMELRRAFKSEHFSHSAIPARDVTEREVGRESLRIRINGFRSDFRAWDRLPAFLCCHFRAILGCQDLRAPQVFIGVNVLWFFLLIFFSSFFLACGFGNILRVTLRKAKNRAGDDKYSGARKPYETGRSGSRAQGDGQQGRVEISSLHVRPTTGGTPFDRDYTKITPLWE